jgi:hypothetical protein
MLAALFSDATVLMFLCFAVSFAGALYCAAAAVKLFFRCCAVGLYGVCRVSTILALRSFVLLSYLYVLLLLFVFLIIFDFSFLFRLCFTLLLSLYSSYKCSYLRQHLNL